MYVHVCSLYLPQQAWFSRLVMLFFYQKETTRYCLALHYHSGLASSDDFKINVEGYMYFHVFATVSLTIISLHRYVQISTSSIKDYS